MLEYAFTFGAIGMLGIGMLVGYLCWGRQAERDLAELSIKHVTLKIASERAIACLAPCHALQCGEFSTREIEVWGELANALWGEEDPIVQMLAGEQSDRMLCVVRDDEGEHMKIPVPGGQL